jgi:hypothetical protein
MRAWFRNLRRPTEKFQPRPQAPARLPRVEALEERCLLQGGPLTNEGFVTQLYRDVLKREPDQAGLTAWTGMLDSGHGQDSKAQQASRAQVAQAFVNSVEYHIDVVQDFYNTFLHRAADPSGLNAWTNFLAQGGTQLQLEAKLLGSDEYFITRGGGTVNGFLQALYQDVLNRQIDPVGLQLATTSLSGNNSVASRTALASAVITSQEGDIVTIDHLYSEFLHRTPDSAGLSAFLAGFQGNQSTNGSGNQNSGNGNNVSGNQNTNGGPPQAAIVPAGIGANGSNSTGSNSGQTSALTVEQAIVDIVSSPEYFSQADR